MLTIANVEKLFLARAGLNHANGSPLDDPIEHSALTNIDRKRNGDMVKFSGVGDCSAEFNHIQEVFGGFPRASQVGDRCSQFRVM
jgi:hypothetical protein